MHIVLEDADATVVSGIAQPFRQEINIITATLNTLRVLPKIRRGLNGISRRGDTQRKGSKSILFDPFPFYSV